MVIVFLGPPGSGKGTQAKRLASRISLIHLSTGDILREDVRLGTPLGREAASFMKSGELVPDRLIIDMITSHMQAATGSRGVILDGFPRNVAQANELDEIFADRGISIDRIIYLNVAEEELVRRLSGRYYCPTCNTGYNYPVHLPKVDGVCDNDGAKILRRPDDEESVVRNRLRVYQEQTSAVIGHYRSHPGFVELTAHDHPDSVTEAILLAVERK